MIRLALAILALSASAAAADTMTAARLVRANAVISPADIAVIDTEVPGALGGDAEIYGLEARRTLYPGHPIRPQDVGPPALVERNQPVVLVYRSGGLTILADARSLSRGSVGEVVKAMNLSSRVTVFGRVEANGTIAVSF